VALACLAAASSAQAADSGPYPNRPIRVIVPASAGTQFDIAARLVASKLAEALGQPVIVENRPGASGNIGSQVVAKAPADGYTLLYTGSLITILPSTMGSQAVDPVTAFAPISNLAEPPIIIVVHPSLNVNTLAELIALAKRQPGKIAYATSGVGTIQHLTAVVISQKAGIDMIHVPYTNTGQALTDVLSGKVPVYFTFLGASDAYLKNGQLKALAVASNRRMRAWPDIPTVVELGYEEAAADPWNGVLAPADTPPEIVNLLYRELARIVQQPDVRDRFMQMGMEPSATTPEQFSAQIKEAVTRWPPVARSVGIRPE
jgi:tripartite-type tricarboxylate transporter receptor subunit TctC